MIVSAAEFHLSHHDGHVLLSICYGAFVVGALLALWPSPPRPTADGRPTSHQRMWLYEVIRYLARDSQWATRLVPTRDTWSGETDQEFLRLTGAGLLIGYGRRYKPEREAGSRPIDRDFWSRAKMFDGFGIMNANTTKHCVYSTSGEAFTEVYFNRRDVRSAWPPRSLWARLRRNSPPERWGTSRHWAEEDAKNDATESAVLDAPNRRPSA